MISTKMYCAISNGSACNTNTYTNSYVLQEMGLDDNIIESANRISWGPHSFADEIIDSFKRKLSITKSFRLIFEGGVQWNLIVLSMLMN